jgi:hypothetical protein
LKLNFDEKTFKSQELQPIKAWIASRQMKMQAWMIVVMIDGGSGGG